VHSGDVRVAVKEVEVYRRECAGLRPGRWGVYEGAGGSVYKAEDVRNNVHMHVY
jgi:hypothetical protein